MKSEDTLDQLLEDSSQVDTLNADVLSAARNVVTGEAQATAARAAKIVQLRRRHRRLTIGVAAAVVAGLVAAPLLSGGHNTSTPAATPSSHAGTHQAPVVQEHFRTAAQVINAAAAASGSANPADAPYWKIVTSWSCSGVADASGTPRPAGSTCENTQWNGNGRPGVMGDANGEYTQIDAATVTVDGRTMGWKQVDGRTWTDTQVASMVADNGPAGNSRAPAGDYVFKNAIGLLVSMPASPTIRKQLWHVLGTVQGAVLNGKVKDALGRTGWKITLNTPGWGKQWLVVDPDTGAVLEDGGNGVTPGTPGWIETIVSAGPAMTAPAVPTQEERAQQLRAKVRACGVTAQMQKSANEIARQTGKMPSFSPSIQACLNKIAVP